MLHFSDGQKLARDIRHWLLSDPLESILTCFPMVLSSLLCVFILAFASCLQHLQLVGTLVEELVAHQGQSSGALAFYLLFCLLGCIWKQGQHSLVFTLQNYLTLRKTFLFFSP